MFIYVYIASFPPYLVHPYMRRATHSSLEVRSCSVLHSRDKRSTPIRYGTVSYTHLTLPTILLV